MSVKVEAIEAKSTFEVSCENGRKYRIERLNETAFQVSNVAGGYVVADILSVSGESGNWLIKPKETYAFPVDDIIKIHDEMVGVSLSVFDTPKEESGGIGFIVSCDGGEEGDLEFRCSVPGPNLVLFARDGQEVLFEFGKEGWSLYNADKCLPINLSLLEDLYSVLVDHVKVDDNGVVSLSVKSNKEA